MNNGVVRVKSSDLILMFKKNGNVKPILKEDLVVDGSVCTRFSMLTSAILGIYVNKFFCWCNSTVKTFFWARVKYSSFGKWTFEYELKVESVGTT